MGKSVAGLFWSQAHRVGLRRTLWEWGREAQLCKPQGNERDALLKLHFVLASHKLACSHLSVRPWSRSFFNTALNKCHRMSEVSWN